jgi:hypothetical protein
MQKEIKKERKVGNGRSTDLGGLVLVLGQHQTVSSWFSARVVLFPNRHCAKPFFPVVCGVRTRHAYYGQGGNGKIPIVASTHYSDLAVAESVPASIRFEVTLQYICLR